MSVINLSSGDSRTGNVPIVYSLECRDGDWYIIITGITDPRITVIELELGGGVQVSFPWAGQVIEQALGIHTGVTLCWLIGGIRNCVPLDLGEGCFCLDDYSLKFVCRNGEVWCDFSSSSRCGKLYDLIMEEWSVKPVLPNIKISNGTLCQPISRSFTINDSRYFGKQVKILLNVYEDSLTPKGKSKLLVCSKYFPGVYDIPICGISDSRDLDL